MLRLDEAAGRHDAGSKAEQLARARRAGLPVLDGFVILPDEEVDAPAIAAALAHLGGDAFAVRSSADLEDRPGLSAAGVFESRIGVPAAAVPSAIAAVRASALGEPARAYLAARGCGAAVARMAVLVQPLARARRLGVLHTEPVEDGAFLAEEREPGEPEWGEVRSRRVLRDEPLGRDAARLATLVGGPADVEYALLGGAGEEEVVCILQARPLTERPHPRDPRRWDPGPPLAAGRVWQRDAEHNPEPLSAAQTSLVELLNAAPGLPRQLLLHGYLFVEEKAADEGAPPPIPAAELPARFVSEVEPACAALLAPLESSPAGDDEAQRLELARVVFVDVAGCYLREISPSIRAARRLLDRFLRRTIGEPLAAHAALLAGTGGRTLARDAALEAIGRAVGAARDRLLSAYLGDFGAYAPAWDVAIPPDDEAPGRVLAAAALVARGPSPAARHGQAVAEAEAEARRCADRLGRADRAELLALLPIVRAAATVIEDDDALFFRAQRAVRRALLALGRRHARAGRLDAPEQIFDLPIEEVRAGAIDAGRARGARALREAARRLTPPVAIRDGEPTWRGGTAGGVLFGCGTAGRGWGRAFVIEASSAPPAALPPGAVLVAEAILPSLTYLLPGAAGLITDHGGALSHAATLAREYGIPAVLGTGIATRALRGGEELLVDGDAGKVYRLGGS